MQSLLDDLAEFNRMNLGLGAPLNRKHSDLEGLLEAEVRLLRAAYPRRRIEFEVRGSTARSWDGLRVQRLLGDLVVNTLK